MFTYLFIFALLASYALRLWLNQRQIRYVAQHRSSVPEQFRERINLADHQRAADYTVAQCRLNFFEFSIDTLLLLSLTLMGGLNWLNQTLQTYLGNGFIYGIGLILSVALINLLIDLPFSIYRQFSIEEKFGFNRMRAKLFITDFLRSLLLGLIIGVPVLFAILWMMRHTGENWWFWTWLFWISFSVLMMIVVPKFIMPLYNRFTPLADESLRTRIEGLLQRCGFKSKGVFVMDGSKRSNHGNAFFTGLGHAKRIVFFDTLIEKLSGDEIEAVLAHELGHFHHRHIIKRFVVSFIASFFGLALLGWLMQQTWFYTDLGITSSLHGQHHALALVLFFLVLPVFTFFITPLGNLTSRKHEFQADAFAASNTKAENLINALLKLYQDNATTLTPDPIYSKFYASHPTASQRIEHLEQLAKHAV